MDYKEYAKQMRENAVKDSNGNIVCSPELWEQIAGTIERLANGGQRLMEVIVSEDIH